ncbi:MAG: Ldh family oxidoreductase [Haliangiales bacterium]
MSDAAQPDPIRVPYERAEAFARALLVSHGADRDQATSIAEVLTWAHSRGGVTEGLWRLPILCRRFADGLYQSPCRPRVQPLSPALVQIDCDGDQFGGSGPYLGQLAMSRAVERARDVGVAMVAVRGGSWFGAAGYYANQAAQADMFGLAMSNSVSKVTPVGGAERVLGTNPIAFAAPRQDQPALLFDTATSATAGSIVSLHEQLGRPLPPDVAVDRAGQPTRDARDVSAGGALLPFGGAKGFGIGLLVEILAGVLTGAGIAREVRSLHHDLDRASNSGFCLIAVDISRFMTVGEFSARLETLAGYILGAGDDVRLPGQRAWAEHAYSREHGVAIDDDTRAKLAAQAAPHQLAVPWG